MKIQNFFSAYKADKKTQNVVKTKRELIQMILNNGVKVQHTLQSQILKKKVLKCFVHGNNRKLQIPEYPQGQSIERQSLRLIKLNRSQSTQRQLVIQAPHIVGVKNQISLKRIETQRTKYRSNSTAQARIFGIRSCCHMRDRPKINTPEVNSFQIVLKTKEESMKKYDKDNYTSQAQINGRKQIVVSQKEFQTKATSKKLRNSLNQ